MTDKYCEAVEPHWIGGVYVTRKLCRYADKYQAKREPKCECEACAKKWAESPHNKQEREWDKFVANAKPSDF